MPERTRLVPGRGFGMVPDAGKDPPKPLPMRAPVPAPEEAPQAPVMGDPLTVPEDASIGYGSEPDEPEPLWLKMPDELAPWFDLGFVHTDNACPYVVMRARDEVNADSEIELSGPPSAFAGLARVIAALCESVPCLAGHVYDEAFTDKQQTG